jgi:hypothetical protein
MSKLNKVRFNLSRGENYMKWKVMYNDGRVDYHHPAEVQINMFGCTLSNSRKTAEKIFTGETTKVVCAYIKCEDVQVITNNFKTESNTQIRYNPRELPFWNIDGKDVDGSYHKELFTIDYKVFLK